MKLSINVGSLQVLFDSEKIARLCHEAGFDGADYGLDCMCNAESPFMGENYVEYTKKVRKIFDDAGLPILQAHAPYFARAREYENEEFYTTRVLPTYKRAVEVAGLLGAKTVVYHPYHYARYSGNEERMFRENMEFFKQLIPIAEEYDIQIAIENMYWGHPVKAGYVIDVCGRSEEFIRYIDTLNSDRIVGCVDIGHVALPLVAEEESWDMIRALGGNRVKALHVHDNCYKTDAHGLPYTGDINWNEVTKALGEIDYQGDMTYEVNGFIRKNMDDEVVKLALKYMADIGKHLCKLVDQNRPNKNCSAE